MEALKDLGMIPRYFGQPFYPAGFPFKSERVSFEGNCAFDLYFQDDWSEENFRFLKQFVAYYLHAPCWYENDKLVQLRALSLLIKTHEELKNLVWDSLELGIDIF